MHVVHLTTHLLPPAQVSKASVPTNVVVSENDLCDRLADALPGDTITYHVGMLARIGRRRRRCSLRTAAATWPLSPTVFCNWPRPAGCIWCSAGLARSALPTC